MCVAAVLLLQASLGHVLNIMFQRFVVQTKMGKTTLVLPTFLKYFRDIF